MGADDRDEGLGRLVPEETEEEHQAPSVDALDQLLSGQLDHGMELDPGQALAPPPAAPPAEPSSNPDVASASPLVSHDIPDELQEHIPAAAPPPVMDPEPLQLDDGQGPADEGPEPEPEEEEEEEAYDGPSILDAPPAPAPEPEPLPQLPPYEGPTLPVTLVASRILAWLALAMALRHLVDVLDGGFRFWHLLQAVLLIWGTGILTLRPRTLMRWFDKIPNSEALLNRFGPKLRISVASMVLVVSAQAISGLFDMILHGFQAMVAALLVGAFMALPAVLEYLFRDGWDGPWPAPFEAWRSAPGPVGQLATELQRRQGWMDTLREESPRIVQVSALTFVCGVLFFWGSGPFANQWLGTNRVELDLVCEDYTVRDGADAWEARNVPAVEWTRVKTEPPDCWIDCVHRNWTEQNRKRAGLKTLGELAMEVSPKCCEICKGQFEKGQSSRTTTCCL